MPSYPFLPNTANLRASTLRNKTSASAALLQQLVAKRLITRESTAAARDLRTTVRVAVLIPDARLPNLNENQQRLLAELASAVAVSLFQKSASLAFRNLPLALSSGAN